MQTSPFYISPNLVVYSTAIYSCLKTSNSSLAFSLLDQVESNLSNLTSSSSSSDSDSISIIYNTVMATQSDPEAVSAVFARMKSLNIPRNLISYSTAMTAKEKNRDYVGVVELASEAERDSIKMDGVMYSTAIHASRELGDTNRVLQLFDDFKKNSPLGEITKSTSTFGSERIGSRPRLRRPDSVLYNLVISSCARVGLSGKARQLLEEMKEVGLPLDVKTYTAVIAAYAKGGEWERCQTLIAEMEQESIMPNVMTFSAVITACAVAAGAAPAVYSARQTPMNNAIVLFDKMKMSKVEPNIVTYNAMIKCCAEGYNPELCMRFFEDCVTKLEPNVVTFGSLMLAYQRAPDNTQNNAGKGARKVFELMNKYDCLPNEIIYSSAVGAFLKCDLVKSAFAVLVDMCGRDDIFVSPTTSSAVISGLLEKGFLDDAEAALKACWLTNPTITNTNRDDISLKNVVVCLARGGHPERAEEWLQIVRSKNKQDTDGSLSTIIPPLYAEIISAYEKKKKFRKALRLLNDMREDNINFYEIKVIDDVFKRLVGVWNKI